MTYTEDFKHILAKRDQVTNANLFVFKNNAPRSIKVFPEEVSDVLLRKYFETLSVVTEENEFVAHFKKYGNIEILTRPLLTELVEEIFVHEGGDIEVVFKFQDAYAQVVEYIELNKHIIEPEKNTKKKKTA